MAPESLALDLHAIYCPLWALFAVVLIESLRNWHDWHNRHPHFMRRRTRVIPAVGLLRGTDLRPTEPEYRRAGGGVGSCPPPDGSQSRRGIGKTAPARKRVDDL